MSIILPIAFAQLTASPEPGLTAYKLLFQSTSFMKGYAAFESLAAASPIASAWALSAAPKRAAAEAAVDNCASRGDFTEDGGGTKPALRRCHTAATATPPRRTLVPFTIAAGALSCASPGMWRYVMALAVTCKKCLS